MEAEPRSSQWKLLSSVLEGKKLEFWAMTLPGSSALLGWIKPPGNIVGQLWSSLPKSPKNLIHIYLKHLLYLTVTFRSLKTSIHRVQGFSTTLRDSPSDSGVVCLVLHHCCAETWIFSSVWGHMGSGSFKPLSHSLHSKDLTFGVLQRLLSLRQFLRPLSLWRLRCSGRGPSCSVTVFGSISSWWFMFLMGPHRAPAGLFNQCMNTVLSQMCVLSRVALI